MLIQGKEQWVGALNSLELTVLLDLCEDCLFFNLDDILGAYLVPLGSWETYIVGEFVLILMNNCAYDKKSL